MHCPTTAARTRWNCSTCGWIRASLGNKFSSQWNVRHRGLTPQKKGWEAAQGKELRKRFEDDEKFKKLIASRKSSGMYDEDEDFPGDDDESKCAKYVWF